MSSGPRSWHSLPQDYHLSLGAITDISVTHKFGKNPVVNTTEEDVWAVGGKEVLPTAGVAMYISCEDNTNGVGQVMVIEGLDANWVVQTQSVTLAGNTKTPIPGTWTRINRAYQISVEPDPVGDVWIYEDDTVVAGVPQTAAKIHAFVDYTNAAQQTEKALYTIPAGCVGLLRRFHAEMGDITTGTARHADVYVEQQKLADGATVDNPSWAPWRRVMGHNVGTTGNSDTTVFQYPLVFTELTNVHARATATANSLIYAEFTLLIIPKALVS